VAPTGSSGRHLVARLEIVFRNGAEEQWLPGDNTHWVPTVVDPPDRIDDHAGFIPQRKGEQTTMVPLLAL
jgi:hypothetical protein